MVSFVGMCVELRIGVNVRLHSLVDVEPVTDQLQILFRFLTNLKYFFWADFSYAPCTSNYYFFVGSTAQNRHA